MARIKYVVFSIGVFVSILMALPCSADVWKCGSRYTNRPEPEEQCELVKGSVVCGAGGNKFFAPKGETGGDFTKCLPTGASSSPFLNEEKANDLIERAKIQREWEERKKAQKNKNTNRGKSLKHSSGSNGSGQTPQSAGLVSSEDMDCIAKAVTSGKGFEQCSALGDLAKGL